MAIARADTGKRIGKHMRRIRCKNLLDLAEADSLDNGVHLLEETVMAPSPVREPCLHQGYYAAEALANSVPIP